ncbi:MAG: sulfatase-like hydrolase/transferase, partial [Planctomycetota bacterium]
MLLRYSLLAFFVLVATDTTLSRAAEKRPNILFIIVDDQSPFDLQVYNSRSTLQTPHINRLAAEGVVFDSAYQMGSWSGAVCTASRHMIMTGRTIWHANSKVAKRSRKTPSSEPQTAATPSLSAEVLAANSLPAVFNAAGYDTMRTCKKGNSFEGANKLFTVRKDATRRGASDEQGSTWHAEQVLDYLGNREATQDKDPFLIYFGFSHPHDTRDGKPELLEKYGATNHTDKSALPPENPKQPA